MIFYEIDGRKVLVPGATELMKYGEFGHAPGFASVVLGRNGAFSHRWHTFPAQPRLRFAVSANELIAEPAGLRDQKEPVTEVVLRRLAEASAHDQLTTLVLAGELPRELYLDLDLARVRETGLVSNFFFDIDDRDLHIASEFGATAVGSARLTQREELDRALQEVASELTDEEELAALDLCRERVLAYYAESETGS